MNSSLITADTTTHLKIVATALLAGIFVVWIGLSARVSTAGASATNPRFERQLTKPSPPPAQLPNTGKVAIG